MANSYEAMLVFSVTKGDESVNALVEKFKALIEANGTIDNIDDWGKRKLAYEINYETEGYYLLVDFTSEPEFPAELDRVVKITEGVLRSLIIKK
ncbi:MAG: 30S ribosomal protein S6 [Clostridia bacterium]|nr:30S ribosomal protein S6 [Clostridia bacterium]MBR3552894.1 30S ribosomal protein S6 [Clostridia bacterium]